MGNTKEFSTLTVAGALTGVCLEDGGFDKIHECSEHLLGRPVWTHEFAHKPTQEAIIAEGKRQFPDMPSQEEAENDWQAAAQKAIAHYGKTVLVTQGSAPRTTGPVGTLNEIFEAKARGEQ